MVNYQVEYNATVRGCWIITVQADDEDHAADKAYDVLRDRLRCVGATVAMVEIVDCESYTKELPEGESDD